VLLQFPATFEGSDKNKDYLCWLIESLDPCRGGVHDFSVDVVPTHCGVSAMVRCPVSEFMGQHNETELG
jgi:hypothetical protein